MFPQIFLLIAIYAKSASSCAATGGGTTPTTNACAKCTLTSPSIEHVKLMEGAIDITSDVLGPLNADGCVTRVISCNGNGAGSTVFIDWNNGQLGTTQGADGANFATDTLTCSADGTQWLLIKNGAMDAITQAECDST